MMFFILKTILFVVLTFNMYSQPQVQCGLVQRLPNYAIVCTDGTIYIDYGGGML